MKEQEIKFTLRIYENTKELSESDVNLLFAAKEALAGAYSPYSKYKVGAAVLLANGKIVTGTNQENAASPAGICAEGTALSAASSLYPDSRILKIAITAKSNGQVIKHPVAPCGVCRQRISEYEDRFNNKIEILFSGEKGQIFSVASVKDILPISFSRYDL